MSAVAAPPSPYKGLAPFEDSALDALFFFGREREIEVIVANLMAARLTVLYGVSGVGKTSLLRAGVAHRLRGAHDASIVVFSSWTGDPVSELLDALEAAAPAEAEPVRRNSSLADTLAAWTRRLDSDLYLVLDQFEEYFLYHEDERGPGTLADELPEALRRRGLRANFLIGIREDSLAQLDAFKPRIPSLFANSLRLDRLDRTAARAAILGPLQRYNELIPGEAAVAAEPKLVEAVLQQVAVGRVDLGQSGRGGLADQEDADRIEAPYLQLVLERLWEVEQAEGSRLLRLETLQRLGGAAQIVQDHLDRAMAELSPDEKDAAAAIYNHLVTPSGTKIAHRARDLAGYAAVDEGETERVLNRLVEERIVRAGENGAEGPRYEIFHDVLAEAVLAWRTRHEAERLLLAERHAAARRHRRMLMIGALGAVVIAALAAIAVFALAQRHDARAQARRARAHELLALASTAAGVDPERAVRLALAASNLESTPAVEDALRRTLRALRVKAVLRGAGGPTTDVAFGERRLITAGGDGTARIYRTKDGEFIRAFRHGSSLSVAAFSPDGVTAVTAGDDGFARLWNVRTGAPLARLRHNGPVTGAEFSRDGSLLATTSDDGSARIWDVRTRRLLHRLEHPSAVADASFSADGKRLVTVLAHFDRVGRVFDVHTGRLVVRLVHPSPITTARFTPTSDYRVVTGSVDHVARIWDAATGARLHDLVGHKGRITDAEFSPDGIYVVTASTDETGRVWEAATGALYGILQDHRNFVLRAVFSPNGKFIATASKDGTARVFDLDGTLKASLVGHGDAVGDVAFSPDGKIVATAGADGSARTWDWRPQPELHLVGRHATRVGAVAFSADDKVLASGSVDGEARVWRLPLRLVGRRDVSAGGGAIGLSDDGRLVATARAGDVRVAELRSGRLVRTLRGAPATVALSFDPGSRRLAAVSGDGTVRVWNLGDGRMSATLRNPGGVVADASFSPDGRRLVTAGPLRTGLVWNLSSGKVELKLTGHTARLTSASFSPDGRWIATTSYDHDGRLWDARSGRMKMLLRDQASFAVVTDADFSADSRWVVTAGPGFAGVWDVRTGRPLYLLNGRETLLTAAAFSHRRWVIATGGEVGNVRIYDCVLCGGLDDLRAVARTRLANLGS